MALDRGGVRRRQPAKPRKRSRLGQQGLPVYVKPDKGTPIGGFLKSAANVIGAVDLPKIPTFGEIGTGSQGIRKRGVKPAKVKHAVEAVGEMSGVQPVRRIRSGKGGWQDWLTVGALALPVAGPGIRTAIGATRQPVKFGILSDPMIDTVFAKGRMQVRAKKPLKGTDNLTGIGESPQVAEMIEALPEFQKPRGLVTAYRVGEAVPGRTADRGYPNRVPIVTDKRGNAYVGQPNWSHGQLLENINARGGELGFGDVQQSHLFQPMDDLLQLELDWGPFTGNQPPVKSAGIRKLIRDLFREYNDPDVMGVRGLNTSDPMNLEGLDPSPRGGVNPVDFDSFARQERMRKRRYGR